MMTQKTMVHYSLVGTTDASVDEVSTNFHPNLLEEFALFLKNEFGKEIQILVEHVEIVDVEEIA